MALIDSLISYWKLDGNSTDAFASNNGSDTSITYNAGNGKLVQGAGYNGTSSKIDLGNPAGLKPTGNFSIAYWQKLASGTGNYCSFSSYSQNTAVAGFFIGVNVVGSNQHKIEFASGKNSGTTQGTDWQMVVSTTTVDNDALHHIVGTWDGTKLHIYVDGAEEGTGVAWTNAPAYAAGNGVAIGARTGTGASNEFWPGALDEVGVWGKALSGAEVTQLYNAGAGLAYPFSSGNPASFLYNFI